MGGHIPHVIVILDDHLRCQLFNKNGLGRRGRHGGKRDPEETGVMGSAHDGGGVVEVISFKDRGNKQSLHQHKGNRNNAAWREDLVHHPRKRPRQRQVTTISRGGVKS